MAKLYVLLKRKGSKRPFGVIPTKKGASIHKLRKIIPKQIKSSYSAKIITEAQLKRLIETMRPKKVKSRKTSIKRRIKKRRKK